MSNQSDVYIGVCRLFVMKGWRIYVGKPQRQLTNIIDNVPGFHVSSPDLCVEFLVNIAENHQLVACVHHLFNRSYEIRHLFRHVVFKAPKGFVNQNTANAWPNKTFRG